MLRIDIFDAETYALKDMCMQYVTLRFERKFRGAGTFTLKLNSLEEAAKFNKRDWVLLGTDWYFVEGIHKYIEDDGLTTIEITGSHVNKVMQWRVFTSHEFPASMSYEQNMCDLVRQTFGDGASAERCIQNLIIDPHVDSHVTSSKHTIESGTVAEALNTYSAHEKLGYKVYVVPEDRTLHFAVLEPHDCSTNVFFSEEYGNVQKAEVYDDCAEVTNTALEYVREEDAITGETWNFDKLHLSTMPTGFERHEILVECSGGGGSADYSQESLSASASLISTAHAEYRTDFDIGSIVNFYDQDMKIQTCKQIRSVTENHDAITTYTINLGDFVPTVFDRILKEARRRK